MTTGPWELGPVVCSDVCLVGRTGPIPKIELIPISIDFRHHLPPSPHPHLHIHPTTYIMNKIVQSVVPPAVYKTVTKDYGYKLSQIPDLTGRTALVTG